MWTSKYLDPQEQDLTYPLVEQTLDDVLVHHLVLVHLADLGCNDFLRIPLDCDTVSIRSL